MIYLIADNTEFELPLATAGSLNALAEMCKVPATDVCRIIRRNSTTKLFQGIPAKIYKISEDENVL